MFHRIFRGHWFTPHLIGTDQRVFWRLISNEPYQTNRAVYGCELCFINNPEQYGRDLHDEGICPKQLMGYTCHRRSVAECGFEEVHVAQIA